MKNEQSIVEMTTTSLYVVVVTTRYLVPDYWYSTTRVRRRYTVDSLPPGIPASS